MLCCGGKPAHEVEPVFAVAERDKADVPGNLKLVDADAFEDTLGQLSILLAVDLEILGIGAGYKYRLRRGSLRESGCAPNIREQCGNNDEAYFHHLTFPVGW